MESELVKIHNTLNFTDRRQLTAEIPEQLMVVKHIKPTDVVLEFGGSIGRKTRSKRQRGGNQEEKDKYLFDAIGIYDYDKVENALNNGANVNALNNDGDTPLIRAINSGEYDVIELLLENGADVTNEEQSLAEDLEEDDQDQSGIPYLIEYYIEIKKKKDDFLLKQNIVAQTIPKHLERQEDRKNLAMVMSEKDVGNVGDGTMPLELRHEIGKYLGGGKRKTRKKNSRGGGGGGKNS